MIYSYIKLGIASLLPVIFAIALYLIDKKTKFGKLNDRIKQIVYGVVFGALAIVGTEWGIPLNGAQVNCRDGAVLTAGLMFGAPAGLIAGLIGGIERWVSVWLEVSEFTRVACSVSTIIAGIYSALLRKFMFENKKPSWGLALAIGIVMEVFHLTMVFITNMDEPTSAMTVVKACTVPMVTANGISVMLASLAIGFLSNDSIRPKQSSVRIAQTIQRWLLATVVLAFLATSIFVYSFQNAVATTQTDNLLENALEDANGDVLDASANRHVGENGFLLVVDSDGNLVSVRSDLDTAKITDELVHLDFPNENKTFTFTLNGEESYCRFATIDGYKVISVLTVSEALQMRNIALYVNTFMEILVFAILFGLIYLLIKRVVVDQIKNINSDLSKITDGDLNVVVNVRTNEEFASLSDDINLTVDTLKNYIAEASARIDQELDFAKNIQHAALPAISTVLSKRKDFDIFASMDPAKEVGGDFYDFYITEGDVLNFLIADVSGKGIPAAMFMMRAKTELKSLTETSMDLSDVFTNSNNALCEGNDAGMFVTAWQGQIDLNTGLVTYTNAGHNPPLVRHANGQFEYLRSRAGFVLAGMDGIQYKTQQLQLQPNDIIYLYTDGVTEATNANNELFGEERLLQTVNNAQFDNMQELCNTIKSAVDKFVGEAPQFDDITMVALKFIGTPPSPKIHFDNASLNDIPVVTEFVESELEKIDCPLKVVTQINIAVDELYSNIVRYGYPNGKTGPVTVEIKVKQESNTVYVKFVDEGVPYNPLTKADPDVTLSAEERQIGGLGIYMVKKTMDDIKYRYENDKNILTIKKVF